MIGIDVTLCSTMTVLLASSLSTGAGFGFFLGVVVVRNGTDVVALRLSVVVIIVMVVTVVKYGSSTVYESTPLFLLPGNLQNKKIRIKRELLHPSSNKRRCSYSLINTQLILLV